MKKIYFFAILCTCVISLKAQFTLTSSFAPVVGDIQNSWTADTTGITAGAAGTNQIWTYSVTVPSSVTVTSDTYVAVSTAPHYTAFPSATIAHTSDGINYNMESYNSNVTIYGTVNNTLVTAYGDPETLCNLPFSYGMVNTDTYSVMTVSGTNTTTIVGTLTTTADGWGTLNILPANKTYTNVLRLKVQTALTATFSPSFTYTQTGVSYIHLCSASKNSILSFSKNYNTSKSGTVIANSVSKSTTVSDAIFTGIKESSLSGSFTMYPNPADNKEVSMRFILTEAENYTATFYNAIGQEIKSMSFGEMPVGPYIVKMDLRDLNSGLYYVKLKGRHSEDVQKLIIR